VATLVATQGGAPPTNAPVGGCVALPVQRASMRSKVSESDSMGFRQNLPLVRRCAQAP
jgi:hypothetical protein